MMKSNANMGLTAYKKKRDLKKTLEPGGKTKKSDNTLIFVVQKHAASRLHYDFRLELEGVLKSWAIPKGPSMNPEDKRLAVMVEDHPYDYKDFEGNIPEGNYGAGNVIVWDNGTYHATGETDKEKSKNILLAGLKKGHLRFVLNGKKLKGEFSLIQLRGKQENAWLLVKKNDEYASSSDILKKDKSVLSNQILKDRKSLGKNSVPARENKKIERLKPMLAEIREKPFDDPNWIFERKYDGYRALAIIDDSDVDLYSRNFLSFNQTFKVIAEQLKKITHTCLLDGEVVVEDKKGISHFQLLQNYQKTGKGILKYYVFDILNLNGIDVVGLPLIERKELLKILLSTAKLDHIFFSEHIKEYGVDFYKLALQHHLEGIMAKDMHSPYRVGRRSKEWLKIKIHQQQEAIILGITQPAGRREYFGSLILGAYHGSKLEYIGNCGTGFNEMMLKEIYTKLQPHFISYSPFDEKIKIRGKIQWVTPRIVCEVKFTEWTEDGSMRHPVFLGLRNDKPAEEVIKEIPRDMKTQTNGNYELKIGKKILKLTNQNKIYWPKEKITKGDLVNYYNEISAVILPYLKDRAQSLHRFPNGIRDKGFYQKDINTNAIPNWIKTEKIYSESNEEYIDYLVCNDKATLLYMANLGCIEIHPWNSRITKLENPDWVIIDLDPELISFKEVVKTALMTKKVFDELNMECYCKTSGATGLHVYVPLEGKYTYEIVRNFAELIAKQVNLLLPDITSILRSPIKRKKKVYVDFLQNRKGQTLAAPYSLRPQPGATVSTPLRWEEINEKLDITQFTIKTIFSRLEKLGDIWRPVIGKGDDLDKAIKTIYEKNINLV